MTSINSIVIDEQFYTKYKHKLKQYINDIDLFIMKGILLTIWLSVIIIIMFTAPKLIISIYMSIHSFIDFIYNNNHIFIHVIPKIIIFIITLLF